MPNLEITPLGTSATVPPGESLLTALRNAGVELESPCNGEGICGRCGVWVEAPSDVPETPHRNITREQADQGLRLACRVRVDRDLRVRLPEDFSLDARILEGDRIAGIHLQPAARVIEEGGRPWLVYGGDRQALESWEPGFGPKGLAIDIGTTSLVLTLLDLATGEELATSSSLNPQTRYGHDILSRIVKGSTPSGLQELADTVQGALNRLLDRACRAAGTDSREVVDVVVGGNTTMLQLAARMDPEPLGHLPFTVGIRGSAVYPAGQFGLRVNPAARLYVPPIAHAFVGSDISAGLLSCDPFFEGGGPLLFVDIGTNGEMGLNAAGRRVVASAAAGPAFEAMGLSSGMRAAAGAVEAVRTDGENLEIRTIDGVPAKGICGSGIIDLVATLLRLGVIDPSGRMRRQEEREGLSSEVAERLDSLDGKPAFRLGVGVFFTQDDVRQLQLAKGAIRTGIDMLLESTGTSAADLENLVLAGAFGYHLRPESLEAIGLIPPGLIRKITFAGNTSRTGCAELLLDASRRDYLQDRMAEVEHLPLAEGAEFQDRFVGNLHFPS